MSLGGTTGGVDAGKALDVVLELHKQLITLATGVIAVSVTFAKDLAQGSPNLWLLKGAWVGYLLSIVFGIWVFMALVGTLSQAVPSAAAVRVGPYRANVALPAAAQILTFALATGAMIWFGLTMDLRAAQPAAPAPPATLRVETLRVDPLKVEPLRTEPLKVEVVAPPAPARP